MKKIKVSRSLVFLLFVFVLIISCDAPRARKTGIIASKNGLTGTSNGYNFVDRTGANNNNTNGAGSTGNNSSNNSGDTTTSTHPTDVNSDCRFSVDGINGFKSVSAHLGSYTLCQSTADKNSFYFQLKTPAIDSRGEVQVCFAPNTTTGSQSIAVGASMCGHFNNPKTVTKITFIKYSRFINANINTLIFFKDSRYFYPVFNLYMLTSDAFSQCMDRLSYGQPAYCDAFKSVGQYVTENF